MISVTEFRFFILQKEKKKYGIITMLGCVKTKKTRSVTHAESLMLRHFPPLYLREIKV